LNGAHCQRENDYRQRNLLLLPESYRCVGGVLLIQKVTVGVCFCKKQKINKKKKNHLGKRI
jgi:hypothetical protein